MRSPENTNSNNPFRFVLTIIVVVFLFLLPITSQASEWNYTQQSAIAWRDYSDSVFLEAKAKDKLLYVLIYANWCHWCKKFETETLETEAIKNILTEDMIPVAINNDTSPELGRKLGAKLVPTSIILTPNGQLLLRFYGFIAADELDEILRKTQQRWKNGEFNKKEFGDESTCCPLPKK